MMIKMLSENCSLIDRYYAVAVRLVMIRQFGISYSSTEIRVLSKFLLNRLFQMISNIPHCLGMSYHVNFLGGLGSYEFHIK